MQEILKIENLKYQYPSYPGLEFPQLLKGINLTVKSGDFIVILGKPETGKSTLLKIILSLIPRYTNGIISGNVEYKGNPVAGYKPYDLIEKIGAVFQDPDEQIFTTSCDTEIAFALESLGLKREEMIRRVNQSLEVLKIEHLRDRNPATLSGGEKKKLLIACLYAANPQMWLLDEIIDELDPGSALNILQKLVKEKRTVILFSSKMLDIFKGISSKFFIMKDGNLLAADKMNNSDLDSLMVEEGLIIDNKHEALKHKQSLNLEHRVVIENLKYKYPGNINFNLHIDNFHINKGEIVSLAGKNGSGKSTLGKLIAGLKEKESGILTVNEKNNLSCAYLFQNPDYQIFLPTVEEELSFGLKLTDAKIEDTIVKFRLPNRNVPPSIMSYGARKRLQAAVYYLMDRDIYILDEADAGLSLKDFDMLINILYKKDKSILIISHNLDLCTRYSNRVYLINSGKIVKEIKTDLHNTLDTYFMTETANL
ncbi:MAG: ATP-binding cassette domain-containing protein [Spirochaetota bacterium]|nr:ATP-binding cassette domain-containing protein [Spirochaetota bacterium]